MQSLNDPVSHIVDVMTIISAKGRSNNGRHFNNVLSVFTSNRDNARLLYNHSLACAELNNTRPRANIAPCRAVTGAQLVVSKRFQLFLKSESKGVFITLPNGWIFPIEVRGFGILHFTAGAWVFFKGVIVRAAFKFH